MRDKQSIRESIWSRIDADPAVHRPPGAAGRIPHFNGAEAAAERLSALPAWQTARVLKLNPDTPQWSVRTRAIEAGKLLYMAVPKLASERPFVALSQSRLRVPAAEAATIEGSARHGVPVRLDEMQRVDLVVCGSVAVNAAGVRIGKGAGYADLEFALLFELGLVTEQTLIATSVHDCQLLDEELPETSHDFRVDVVVTPTRVLHCPRVERPRGLFWEQLDAEKIAAIPVLAARRREAGLAGRSR